MAYDRPTVLSRIKSLLPNRWFSASAPVLDTVLGALASGWSDVTVVIDDMAAETRIHSATAAWLDLAATDFLGARLPRRRNEQDNLFRTRLIFELRKDRCTRAALTAVLTQATGREPRIFEPARPQDTGCYGSATARHLGFLGYGAAGGWGSMLLPYQSFVQAYRPVAAGIARIAGWGTPAGGYGNGNLAYLDPSNNAYVIGDTEILDEIKRILPAATTVWVAIVP